MKSLKRSYGNDPLATNISSKIFVRSTKSGKVQKVVRELYLRQDIPCSSKLCSECLSIAPSAADGSGKSNCQVQEDVLIEVIVAPFVLSERPAAIKSYPKGHYLVPDTNVLLNALDVFEQTSAFYDVIILQTVLEELRNRSLPLYNRVVGLSKSEEKRFYIFFNDFRLETYIVREEGETINDRNDRAVRKATEWYGEHLAKTAGKGRGAKKIPTIIMLSEDAENLRKAKEEGLEASTRRSFSKCLKQSTNATQ
jgi:exosome complex exonuclease DIS3/RRP44